MSFVTNYIEPLLRPDVGLVTIGVLAALLNFLVRRRVRRFQMSELSMVPSKREIQLHERDRKERQKLASKTVGRRIVCAANRFSNGVVVLGVRHHDALMNRAIERCIRLSMVGDHEKSEQGFVDNMGEFLTRQEAWEVAFAAGQILRRVGGDDRGRLFSENYC